MFDCACPCVFAVASVCPCSFVFVRLWLHSFHWVVLVCAWSSYLLVQQLFAMFVYVCSYLLDCVSMFSCMCLFNQICLQLQDFVRVGV